MPGLQVPIVLEADHCQELGMVSQWAWAVFSWWEDFRGGSGTRVPALGRRCLVLFGCILLGVIKVFPFLRAFDSFLVGWEPPSRLHPILIELHTH